MRTWFERMKAGRSPWARFGMPAPVRVPVCVCVCVLLGLRLRLRLRVPPLALTLALALAGGAQAQFDPTKAVLEPEAIARQFPDPARPFTTPAFAPGRQDFTSHAEVFGFLDGLARRSARLSLETVGHSQQGRAMTLAVLAGPRGFDAQLPTVMVLAQQHGNEPAGGEAALVLVQSLANERSALLERVNVLIMPRANPDAAERFARESANGIDLNRDHLLVRTPELQAITAAARRYAPQVVLDLHEFTVAGRWVSKFGALMRADALLQAATVGNLSPGVQATQGRYVAAARQALEAAGHRVDDYHTTSSDAKDLTVSMGGVNADTGRNVAGLRHAISLLLETRGVGLGRAHYARRVQSHVLGTLAVIEAAAQEGATLVQMQRDAGAAAAGLACSGTLAVVVRQTAQRRNLSFLDAKTGEPREVEVAWRASDPLERVRERTRPCGYLIGAEQTAAVRRLRNLGLEVSTVASVAAQANVGASEPQALWDVEDYVLEAEASGQRQDARGAIADEQDNIRVLRVQTRPGRLLPAPGSFYVSLNQPLAALASAALEPDSQNSLAANRLLGLEAGQLRRVVRPPPAGALSPALP
jgi:predicted deacylase/post-segregation antitoxin (ccd killing protein)